ncbi:hypothetical protein [Croceitalea rosinachiae]|uniref:Uncharacterized protein n=1 Tax=Croceitalea rosinachiae TaxID=3075596 RepID=A0ABU3AEZ1_9FLAO|nr:hypothetical protein [Croceitalea sp. F388]MDT0608102.1 hypothetical protein [Croceitalea sp. F388]
MKNTSKFWSLLGLTIVFSACQERPKKENQETPAEEVKPMVVEAPKGIIPNTEAKAIYDNYSTNRVPIIKEYEERRSPSEDFVVTRFIDFDYKSIRQYLDYIDQEAANGGVKNVTKLRVYLAEYDSENKNSRRNTVFFVPTMDVNGENLGFFIGEDGKAKTIRSITQADDMKQMGNIQSKEQKNFAGLFPSFSLNTSLQGGGSLTYNRGTSAPPPNADY